MWRGTLAMLCSLGALRILLGTSDEAARLTRAGHNQYTTDYLAPSLGATHLGTIQRRAASPRALQVSRTPSVPAAGRAAGTQSLPRRSNRSSLSPHRPPHRSRTPRRTAG